MILNDALFEDSLSLVEHATEQIREAQDIARAFFNRRPFARIVDLDPENNAEIHKIRLTARFPDKISRIIKDATSNLRDALDHAVFASAVALTGDGNPNDTGFPFGPDQAGVERELVRTRLSGNPPEIRPCLAAFQPHETGNPILWSLNKIRNSNTHRVVIPVVTAIINHKAYLKKLEVNGIFKFGYNIWDESKGELEYMRVGRGSKYDYHIEMNFVVNFSGIDALKGQDAFIALDRMANEVLVTVIKIKDETARILRNRDQPDTCRVPSDGPEHLR